MTHHRIAQAERDAETARNNLERSLEELRGRLTPGRVLDETLSYARNGSGAQFVKTFGRQVRSNPLPVALVGAGLAWLMLARREGDEYGYYSGDLETRYRAADDGISGYESDQSSTTSSLSSKASDAASRIGDAAGRMGEAMTATRDRVSGAFGSAADTASEAAQRMRRSKNDAMDRAADLGRRTSDSVSHLMETQPLLLGAFGLALGAVLGSVFPSTRTEDRIAGAASDDLKQQAKSAMREQADKAMNVAERVYESAYKEGERAAKDEGWMSSGQSPSQASATGSETSATIEPDKTRTEDKSKAEADRIKESTSIQGMA